MSNDLQTNLGCFMMIMTVFCTATLRIFFFTMHAGVKELISHSVFNDKIEICSTLSDQLLVCLVI